MPEPCRRRSAARSRSSPTCRARSSGSASSSGPRSSRSATDVVVAGQDACGKDDLPVAPDVLALGARGRRRRPHRRRPRPPPRRATRRRAGHLRRRDGRHRRAAQGRERPGRPAPRPVADGEGPRRSRLRALARRRLRRAVVRPLARGRRRAEGTHRGRRLAGVGDREDRAEGGGRCARRDPRRRRRGDDRPRRPRRRDRRGGGPAPAEEDHRRGARARKARDHGDADARDDDPPPRADARRGVGRRERDPRRDVGAHAVGRDGGRRVPGRGRRDDGAHRARGRAEPRLPAPAAVRARRSHRRTRDVERRLRPRRGARRARRSSCRRSPVGPPPRSLASGPAGLSSHSPTSPRRCSTWRSSGA